MRVLAASTRGMGHFNPLVPFLDACLRGGHEVLVGGPPTLAAAVESAGYDFWEFDDPPADELDEVWSRVPSLPPDEQNALVVRDIFARLDATASLPQLRAACRDWHPDVVLREGNEYGSAIAADLHGIPHARVGIGLSSMEELGLEIAAGTLAELRRSVGLPADPNAETLRRSPYLTLFPGPLEIPAEPGVARALRFRDPNWDERPSELPASWSDGAEPLVYVTFGSVAAGMEMAARAYEAALAAVADLPVRALLTVGHGADLARFSATPKNVHVEHWVPQADVLARAAAVVCHGGSGSTLGALAAGVPLVVVPLFADQPLNARRVEAVGAGLVVRPPDPTAIRAAVRRVLQEEPFRAAAERLAAELRSQPPTDAAVELLGQLAQRRAAR